MRKAISSALEEAGRLGQEEAFPEHLLLAIARDRESAAAFMFEQSGISTGELVEQLQRDAPKTPQRLQRALRLAPQTLHVLDVAIGQSDELGHPHVGTEHVALSLSLTNGNLASEHLRRAGFTHERARGALKAWIDQNMPRRRHGPAAMVIRSPLLRRLFRPVQKAMNVPVMAWQIFARRSLGHPKFVTDPYPLYRWLQRHRPVRRDPLAPVWVVTRYNDVMTVLRDPRFLKDPFAGERLPRAVREQLHAPPDASARSSIETVSMLFLDPPEHTRIRSIFTKAFTPRRIENLRPRIGQICDKRLDRAAAKGALELMSDLAAPLPVTVIAELLGFPPEDYPKIKKWSDDMAESLGLNPSADSQLRAAIARDELRAYFDQVVTDLRQNPGDNLLSALLHSNDEKLTHEELFSNAVLLLAAGHETTTNLIGNGVRALLRHPDQLRDLRDNPNLIDGAIEEMLRFDPPVQWTSRVAGQPIELSGQTLPRGDIVLASLGAANRDPDVFHNPDRFDIRRNETRHIAFGAGPHFCLGAALARMEAAIAIQTLITRFPNLRLKPGKLQWQKGLTFRGLKCLHLEIK